MLLSLLVPNVSPYIFRRGHIHTFEGFLHPRSPKRVPPCLTPHSGDIRGYAWIIAMSSLFPVMLFKKDNYPSSLHQILRKSHNFARKSPLSNPARRRRVQPRPVLSTVCLGKGNPCVSALQHSRPSFSAARCTPPSERVVLINSECMFSDEMALEHWIF